MIKRIRDGIEVLDASIVDVHPDKKLKQAIDNRVTALQEKQQAQAEQDAEQAQDAASWEENWQAQNADADEDDLLLSDDDTTAAIESAIDTPAETPETTEA